MIHKSHLQAFLDIVPFLGEIINEDISIGVMDSHKMLASQSGRILKSQDKAGDANNYSDFHLDILKKKKFFSFEDISDRFPVPVEVTFTPVLEESGESDILIAIVKNIEKRKSAEVASKKLGTSFEQVDEALGRIAGGSQVLAGNLSEIAAFTKQMKDNLIKIDELISGIRAISMRSSILAINAGIEAVHAGSSGNGFSVIAKEIGSLSQSSDHAAETIAETLTNIKKHIEIIDNRINTLSEYSKDQATSTQKISSTMNEIYNAFKVIAEKN